LRNYITLLLILASLASASALAAPRTDIVVLLNGDRLTGEVKQLFRGKLRFKTDTADTIEIQWDKVATVESRQRLQVELANGEQLYGSAEASPVSGQLQLKDGPDSKPVSLPLISIVQIHPIDQGTRLARLDGYLTGGYNYTKANHLQEFVFTGGLSTTQERHRWSVDASTAVTTQDGANDTQRFDVTGQFRRFLAQRWFWQGTLEFASNDELGLDLRTALGAAFGRYLLQSHYHEWAAYVGANVTNESEVAAPSRQNVEAVFGTQFAFFQYDTPERTLNAQLDLLPSLTDSGRIRADAKLVSRLEIVKDFFFELALYGTYDNRPAANAKSDSDYGTELSLGYSF
jgi:putative salt-induced outer membrane protein YdiY